MRLISPYLREVKGNALSNAVTLSIVITLWHPSYLQTRSNMMTLPKRNTEACQSPHRTHSTLPSLGPPQQDLSLGDNYQVREEATGTLHCGVERHLYILRCK